MPPTPDMDERPKPHTLSDAKLADRLHVARRRYSSFGTTCQVGKAHI